MGMWAEIRNLALDTSTLGTLLSNPTVKLSKQLDILSRHQAEDMHLGKQTKAMKLP